MSRLLITTEQRRARLGRRHRLTPSSRTDDVVSIANDLVALHASDPATVFLSAATRMSNPSIDQIEHALYEDRSVLRHHAMRRTLWVASSAVTQIANAACTRKIATVERRKNLQFLAQTAGITDPETTLTDTSERLLALIARSGATTTREIGRSDPQLAFKITIGSGDRTVDVGAHVRVAALAAFDAQLIRTRPNGSWITSEYAWELTERWTSINFDEPATDIAMAALVRRWLDRFGPGTERDLIWWTGSTKSAVRAALRAIEAVEVDLEGDISGWVNADDPLLDSSGILDEGEAWVAVLPGLDPTVMGWKDRDWYLDPGLVQRLFDRNGNAGPTIWIDGRVVGGWTQRPDGTLALDLLEQLSKPQLEALDVEIERVRLFVGDVRFRVRFPSRNQKELLGE